MDTSDTSISYVEYLPQDLDRVHSKMKEDVSASETSDTSWWYPKEPNLVPCLWVLCIKSLITEKI